MIACSIRTAPSEWAKRPSTELAVLDQERPRDRRGQPGHLQHVGAGVHIWGAVGLAHIHRYHRPLDPDLTAPHMVAGLGRDECVCQGVPDGKRVDLDHSFVHRGSLDD